MTKPLALVIDDEPDICELLSLTLGRMDIRTETAMDVASAKSFLQSRSFDLCLTDMRLPDGDGLELVEWMQVNAPGVPVAVITAHGNVETAVQALKLGAFDFISKPLDLNYLRNIVENALKVDRNTGEKRSQLLGDSEPMRELRDMVDKVARSQAPVHISGESGTGKELVARLIHDSGPRADGPFVPVNCGAIPAELMESEFFGHRKGSFTGAVSDKTGLVQSADGGTLFLDEIADLPLAMQVKLLRVIQEKTVRPVGASGGRCSSSGQVIRCSRSRRSSASRSASSALRSRGDHAHLVHAPGGPPSEPSSNTWSTGRWPLASNRRSQGRRTRPARRAHRQFLRQLPHRSGSNPECVCRQPLFRSPSRLRGSG